MEHTPANKRGHPCLRERCAARWRADCCSSRRTRPSFKLEAVYFCDVITADGEADFHPLSGAARNRVGRYVHLNEAYVGIKESASGAPFGARLGNLNKETTPIASPIATSYRSCFPGSFQALARLRPHSNGSARGTSHDAHRTG